MTRLGRLRRRLGAEYPSSLLTGYLAMAAAMVAQVVIVPIYLATLGPASFGAMTLVLGLIGYAAVGIGWLSGGLQRLLGEAYGTRDHAGFAAAVETGKILFVGYAAVAALAGVGLSRGPAGASVPLAAAVAAALYLIASYEAAVERLALAAAGRLAAANVLQFVQVAVYAASVVIVLYAGGGLAGVFVCHLGSVLVARVATRRAWQGGRPALTWPSRDAVRAMVRRLTGRMGGGYFLFGALVLTSQSDVLVVGWLGGAEDAARFVLVWKIAEVGVQVLWRVPETLTPILVRLDAVGERETIRARYRRVRWLMLAMAVPGGVCYALLGPWITRLWLGPEHAPQDRLGFVLAGAAIVWVGLMRLPAVLGYALARFRMINTVSFVEVAGRIGLTVALYPQFGYLSPLVALNVVHIAGLSIAYQWVGRGLAAGRW